MEIKPVIAKKPPEYPTEYLFINNPELFKRYIPLRWYKNKLVCTALSVFIVAGTSSCDSDSLHLKKEITFVKNLFDTKINKDSMRNQCKVAPVFVHGNGTGATGCIVMSAPVFISEYEAWEIITEELRKSNIELDRKDCPIIRFETNAFTHNAMDPEIKDEMVEVNLKLDRIIKKHNIYLEYISAEDYSKYEAKTKYMLSARSYYTKKAAKILRNELANEGLYNAAIFYDPLQYIKSVEKRDINGKLDFWQMRNDSQAKAKQLLVAQVQDFINWLKTEGIIK